LEMIEPPNTVPNEELVKEVKAPFNMKISWTLYVVLGIFVLGLIAGLLIKVPLDTFITLYQNVIDTGEEFSSFETFRAIFFNNTRVLLLSVILSPFVIPVFFIDFINGFVLTALSSATVAEGSLTVGKLLLAILPHGIIEFTAHLVGWSAALSAVVILIVNLFKGISFKAMWPMLKNRLIILGCCVVAMCFAALVETFVTPLLISLKIK
ncbi:MAG: stage II sporulation protein M, partial [Oscillospiraceae bacterium]|nr:stage II sporulation protein M [Oscillospiraceae bacterium]